MDKATRVKFKNMIEEHIQQVEKDIISYKELSKPISPDNAIGRLSRMEAISEKSVSENNLRKATTRLQELQKALSRVETEDYGLCARCEEDISPKRLEILPESTLCMPCLRGPKKII